MKYNIVHELKMKDAFRKEKKTKSYILVLLSLMLFCFEAFLCYENLKLYTTILDKVGVLFGSYIAGTSRVF